MSCLNIISQGAERASPLNLANASKVFSQLILLYRSVLIRNLNDDMLHLVSIVVKFDLSV